MNRLDSFNKKYIELYCKLYVLWWLELYNPDEWRDHGNYFTIDINKERGWYFDMGPGEVRSGGDKKFWCVGLSGANPLDFYWLYKFDPEVQQLGFDESNWHHDEFELLIKDYAKRGEIEELYQSLSKTELRDKRELPLICG